jgi:hypothetical protein
MVDTRHREWLFRVVYKSDAGRIEVDYLVDTMEEAQTAIAQGPYGLQAVLFMGLMRNMDDEVPTIERLAVLKETIQIPGLGH